MRCLRLTPWFLVAALLANAAEKPAPVKSKQAASGRPLAGVIVDAAGNPAAEAEVWLVCSSLDGAPTTLSKTTADKEGRFQVEVPAWWFQMTHGLCQELGLLAYKSGYHLGGVAFSRSSIPPETGARLELGPLVASTISIVDPANQALAGAKVSVQSLTVDQVYAGDSEEYIRRLAEANAKEFKATPNGYLWDKFQILVPPELSQRLTVATDAQGVAKSDVVSFAEAGLSITTEKYGTQTVALNLHTGQQTGTKAEMPTTVTLRPVGRLSGRVLAKDLQAVRGLAVTVATSDSDPYKDAILFGSFAEVRLDAEGKFEVPALAPGNVRVQIPLKDTLYRMDSPLKPPVRIKAGEQASIEIPLRLGVEVIGVVRERGANKPIPHLLMMVFSGEGDNLEQVMTDAEGRYTCRVLPGQIQRLTGIPAGFVPIDRRKREAPLKVPDQVARHELPPLELERAPVLRGTVVDESGKPALGATVQVNWTGPSRRRGSDDILETTQVCDEKGAFAIEDVILRTEEIHSPGGLVAAKQTEARLKARSGDAVTEKSLIVSGDLSKPVILRISKAYAVALSGKVTDMAGKPVAGVKVQLWQRLWMPPPNQGTPRLIAFAPPTEVRTDAAGKFVTPRQLERDGEVRAEVEGEGIQTTRTDWIKITETKSDAFPDLVVSRVGILAGKILDMQGQPVLSARITHTHDGPQRLSATSDAKGEFRLANVPDGRGFLFVEAGGFRFHGQLLAPGTKETDVILARTRETVAKPLQTLPDVLSRDARHALLKRVFEPVIKQTLEIGEDHAEYRMLNRLAVLEPTRVLEILDKKPFKDASYADAPRLAAAKALARTSQDEAIALLEALPEAHARAHTYVEFADLLPADQKARRIELLSQALVQARNIQDASQRTVMLALITDRLWELGEKDRATKLIDEGLKLARNLPSQAWAGYARSVMAQSVAHTDLPTALELLKDLREEGEFDRQHGNLAWRVADKHPAEAERIVGLLKDERRTYRYMILPYVCFRMAPVDLERARRIADRASDQYYRPHSYAKMAQALAKSNPAEATKLLHEAFGQLKEIAESPKDLGNGQHDAAALAAGLLSIAEQIDPQLVPEFLWRALSLRRPPAEQDADRLGRTAIRASHEASLALALARYDRSLAGTLIEPWSKRVVSHLNTGGYPHRVYEAALLIDPEWALRLVAELPDGPLKKEIVLTQINLLSLHGDELWRQALQSIGIAEDNRNDF